jgi:hypothetical protein
MNVHLVSTAAYGKEFGEQYPDIFQHSFGKYQALKTIIVHLKRLAKGEK